MLASAIEQFGRNCVYCVVIAICCKGEAPGLVLCTRMWYRSALCVSRSAGKALILSLVLAEGMADLVAGLACFLAIIDVQVGCRQVEVARLLHVS